MSPEVLFPEVRYLSDLLTDLRHFRTVIPKSKESPVRIDIPYVFLRKGYYFVTGMKNSIFYSGGVKRLEGCNYLYGMVNPLLVHSIADRLSEKKIGSIDVISRGRGKTLVRARSADGASLINVCLVEHDPRFKTVY